MSLKIIGIIPARGGSKGVPRKNIRPLAGKPLLAYTAEAALDLIDVDYEELPAVFEEQEAAAAGALVLHDTIRPASMFVDLKHLDARSGTNVGMEYRLRSGDVDEGFAQAGPLWSVDWTSETSCSPTSKKRSSGRTRCASSSEAARLQR